MPTALECLVERRTRYLLVRLVGPLDLAGTARVRTTLRKCLAEQPDAVVLDLSGVETCSPTSFAAFRLVAREAARWPAIPVLMCAPSPAVARLLTGPAAFAGLTVHPTVEAAAARIGWGPAAPAIVDDLLPVAGAARRAREMVTEACARWDLPHLVGPACVVVSELVNNAVEHAGTMITVRITVRPRALHIAVQDGSPEPPVLDGPGPREAARGLRLIDAEAFAWGHSATIDGKVVWASLSRERAGRGG
jgi:anti-anti-sigma regulatory factor